METKLLGEFDIYINDGNYGNIYPEKDKFLKSGIPFISATDFKGRVFNYKGIKYIGEDLHFNLLTKGHLKLNDVVIVVRGNGIGKVGFFKDKIGECNMNAQLAFIRTNPEELNSKYLYYLFSGNEYLNLIKKFGSGSAQPQLPINRLKLVPVICKDIKVQNGIAKVLSDLDDKIELNNKINQELEAMAKTIYDYWFVQFDFPDATGKPYKSSGGKMKYNEELKREIPKGFLHKSLAKITDVSNESINPMLTPAKLFKHYSIPTFDAIKTYGIEKGVGIRSNKFVVRENDLLISKLNPKFNRVIYPKLENDLICSTEFVVCRTSNLYLKNFLYMLATGEHFIAHCTQSATGTSNSHKRVNPNVMMSYQVAYNDELIQEFGKTIDSWIKKRINNLQENQKLAELRDWLLPMLMNGQVTVKEAEVQINMAVEAKGK